jgi:hypothetical protein
MARALLLVMAGALCVGAAAFVPVLPRADLCPAAGAPQPWRGRVGRPYPRPSCGGVAPGGRRMLALRAEIEGGGGAAPAPSRGVLAGRVVAITGNFGKRRPELEDIIKAEGPTFSGTVSQ